MKGEAEPLARTLAAIVSAYVEQLQAGRGPETLAKLETLKARMYEDLAGIVGAAVAPVNRCSGANKAIALELTALLLGEVADAFDDAGRLYFDQVETLAKPYWPKETRASDWN